MEKSLIAAMIIDPDIIEIVSSIVTREDFSSVTHRMTYDLIMELHRDGQVIGLIPVYNLATKKGIENIITAVYLAQVCDSAIIPTPVTVAWVIAARRQAVDRRKRLKIINGSKEG